MKKRSLNWDDLLTLSVLARAGNYSAAARELGLTHATVGRRLRRLEASAGVALLLRRESGFRLTAAGLAALSAAQEMEQAAGRFERRLAAEPAGIGGRVRIAATETLGGYFFVPRLAQLHERHPGLAIEMRLEHRTLSLARRKADLALRLARPRAEGLVARRLGALGYGLYMARRHPEFARCLGSIEGPLPLLRLDDSDPALAELPESRWVDAHLPAARCVFTANSGPALWLAARAGWGAALLPCFLAGGDPELAALVPAPVLQREIWLAYPKEYRKLPRLRAVVDWLAAVALDEAALLAGGAAGRAAS